MARFLLAAAAAAIVAASAYAIVTPHRPALDATVVALDGRQVRVGEMKGKVTAISFWATWCGACKREMPRMVEAQRKFGPRGYETVAIAVRDSTDAVAEYARRTGLPFHVVLDRGEAAARFGNVRVTPTTFLLDRNGRVVKRFVGEPDWHAYDAAVEKALAD